MAFSLKKFEKYNDIVVQCHDNPDADAIASGYALYSFFKKKGKNVRFIYSGRFEIQKSNLVLMTESLEIPIEYVKELDMPELLITVDCQYGESNVTRFDAKEIAVIDHHQVSGTLPEMSDVRSGYGACSTIMWDLLAKEGIDINEDEELATALYYGLFTDTNGFSELHHPADKDLRDTAIVKQSLITLFRNCNLSMDELRIAGSALKRAVTVEEYKYALVEADPCDPNILGIISDMLLEVDSVETCLVYSVLEFGVKISVRSCVATVQANELAGYIADGLGGGGGHLIKAGGFLKKDLIEKSGIQYNTDAIREMLVARMDSYFKDSIILYAGEHIEDVNKLKKYVKKKVKVGYVHSTDLAPAGTKIVVRTLEGDVDITTDEDTYIIIGVKGEIYPSKKDKFEKGYEYLDEPYDFEGEYPPAVLASATGDRIEILPFAKSCTANGGSTIYARELTKRTKVFTSWDTEKYYLGRPGDYLATRTDDIKDIYIIAREIFYMTYGEV